jgi:hypothetical protein
MIGVASCRGELVLVVVLTMLSQVVDCTGIPLISPGVYNAKQQLTLVRTGKATALLQVFHVDAAC